jgi:4'-phosphopantetheinyl transferase
VTLPTVRLPAVGTVDVWTFELGSWEDESALSAQEEIASTRFRFDRDRVRFRRRRAHYRSALSRYAGRPAAALQFTTNAFGKPSLAGVDALWFSASSREDVAVLAVSQHRVGIDVEVVRPERADIEVARSLFAPEEAEALESAPAADFFRCWTRKEAYVKAIGRGLSFPLESFAVETGAVLHPRLLRSSQRPDDVGACRLVDVSPLGPDIVISLAVFCRDPRIAMFRTANQGVDHDH